MTDPMRCASRVCQAGVVTLGRHLTALVWDALNAVQLGPARFERSNRGGRRASPRDRQRWRTRHNFRHDAPCILASVPRITAGPD